MSKKQENENSFLKNLNFFIDNKRYYDAIQILNNLEMEMNKNSSLISFNNKPAIADIINNLDGNSADLKKVTSYFKDETLDSSEIYFLQQQMNFDNLDENSSLIYDLLTKSEFYSSIEQAVDNLKSDLIILKDLKINNI